MKCSISYVSVAKDIVETLKSQIFDITKVEEIVDRYKAQGGDLNERPMFDATILLNIINWYGRLSRTQDKVLLENKMLEIVKLLIAKGASHKACGHPEFTAIILKLESIKSYLNSKEDIYFPTKTDEKQKEVLDLLNKHGIEVESMDPKYYRMILHHYKVIQNLSLVKILAEEYEADVNGWSFESSEVTPLTAAIKCGSLEVVKYLLQKGADANYIYYGVQEKYNMLHLAAESLIIDAPKIVEYLLNNTNISINGRTLGHKEEITKFTDNYTPLHLAVLKKNYETATVLLQHGADINLKTSKGKTALSLSVEKGDLKMTECLILRYADIESVDVRLIKDAPIQRVVDIASVIQNLCKLQGDKNTIELSNMTETECTFAKDMVINYLSKQGLPNNFHTHLEEFLPLGIKKYILSCIEKCISGYTQDLGILESKLIGATQGHLDKDLHGIPYRELLLFKDKGGKIDKTGEAVLAFYQQYPQYKKLGTYLLETIEQEIDGISILNQLMLGDMHITELVIDLSKRIMPEDIKLALKEALIRHELYNVLPGFEDLKHVAEDSAPSDSKIEWPIETETLVTEEKLLSGDTDTLY